MSYNYAALYTAGQDRENSLANNKLRATAEPISMAPVIHQFLKNSPGPMRKSADAQRRSYTALEENELN